MFLTEGIDKIRTNVLCLITFFPKINEIKWKFKMEMA
jgi:hypothetical protein